MDSQNVDAHSIGRDESRKIILSTDSLEYEDDLTDEEWSAFSLAQACAGLEDDGPAYGIDDLIEVYSHLTLENTERH